MYTDKLYIVRHRPDGTVEVEHRYGAIVRGKYIGYSKGNAYKLYPRKHVYQPELRFAGKVVSLHDMILELPPEPAKPKEKENKPTKVEQIKLCEQIKLF